MRTAILPLLLGAALLGGHARTAIAGKDDAVVRDEAANFEISLPPEKAGDWDRMDDKDRKDIKAHFRTVFVDTEPLATAEIQLIVFPLRKDLATRGLDAIAGQWASVMEGSIENQRDIKEDKATLGGQEAYYRDLKGDLADGSGVAHITWHITKMGKFLYVLHVIRTYRAVGDEGLEEEIVKIRDSFKFLKEVKVEADAKAKDGAPGAPGGAGAHDKAKEPDPELVKRQEMENDFWKIKFVKPEGLLNIPPERFDDYEKNNHVIAKFDRTQDQNRLLIRIYAQLEKNQSYTIEQLAETYLKYFKQQYNEKSRLPEEIDNSYKKFPQAKDAIKMKLVGRRTVPEILYWYLAQCKNGRQYQIEIHLWGAESEKFFKNHLDDFMRSLKPQDD